MLDGVNPRCKRLHLPYPAPLSNRVPGSKKKSRQWHGECHTGMSGGAPDGPDEAVAVH